jgi:hypothetical protein
VWSLDFCVCMCARQRGMHSTTSWAKFGHVVEPGADHCPGIGWVTCSLDAIKADSCFIAAQFALVLSKIHLYECQLISLLCAHTCLQAHPRAFLACVLHTSVQHPAHCHPSHPSSSPQNFQQQSHLPHAGLILCTLFHSHHSHGESALSF